MKDTLIGIVAIIILVLVLGIMGGMKVSSIESRQEEMGHENIEHDQDL